MLKKLSYQSLFQILQANENLIDHFVNSECFIPKGSMLSFVPCLYKDTRVPLAIVASFFGRSQRGGL